MRGGMRINVPRDNGTTGGCTNGFNVEGAGLNNNHWRYTLVAGHCILGRNHHKTEYTHHNGTPVGYQGAPAMKDYPYDFAIMPYRWGDLATYWMSDGADNLVLSISPCQPGSTYSSLNVGISGVQKYSRIYKGEILCASGSAYRDSGAPVGWWPGTRCGAVIEKNGGIKANICGRRGDSGGPLYSQVNNKAYGILHGGWDPKDYPQFPPDECTQKDEKGRLVEVRLVLKSGPNHV
jgi:streptogrisin C